MPKRSQRLKQLEPSCKLLTHLSSLGIQSVAEYQTWCSDNGFGAGLNKPNKMLNRELRCRRELNAASLRRQRARQSVNDRKLMLELLRRDQPKLLESFGHLRGYSLLAKRVSYGSRERKSLQALVEHLTQVRSRLTDPNCNSVCLLENGISIAESLVLLADQSRHWKRPVNDWKPRSKNVRKQFRSLVRHLLDRYGDVPKFMDQAWTIGLDQSGSLDPTGKRYRHWWVDLGAGYNLRKLIGLPIDVTKRMAHFFRDAPSFMAIPSALRWAQIRGLGGEDYFARAILATRLGEGFEHDEFWITVIRWFMDQPTLSYSSLGPIVDYVHNRRFVPERVQVLAEQPELFDANGNPLPRFAAQVPEPNLTMRGRTMASMERAVEQWHRSLARDTRVFVGKWSACGVPEFSFSEGREESENFRIWTIRELLSGRQLAVEGRKMKHCVASYLDQCKRGDSAIWSLEVESYDGLEKRITLELHPASKTIVQARGKNNRLMSEQERGIVRRWCTQAGLTIANCV